MYIWLSITCRYNTYLCKKTLLSKWMCSVYDEYTIYTLPSFILSIYLYPYIFYLSISLYPHTFFIYLSIQCFLDTLEKKAVFTTWIDMKITGNFKIFLFELKIDRIQIVMICKACLFSFSWKSNSSFHHKIATSIYIVAQCRSKFNGKINISSSMSQNKSAFENATYISLVS